MGADERVPQPVFAVASADPARAHLLGFGRYVGDHPRPGTPVWEDRPERDKDLYRAGDADPFDPVPFYASLVAKGEMTRTEADAVLAAGTERQAVEVARPLDERAAELAERMAQNPKIVLDDGEVVWGFECWWAPADQCERFVAGRQVVEQTVTELRGGTRT